MIILGRPDRDGVGPAEMMVCSQLLCAVLDWFVASMTSFRTGTDGLVG